MAKNSFAVEVTLKENICLLNVGEFGKEAADVIQNNFYVDDLIKSVEDRNTAKTLVKNAEVGGLISQSLYQAARNY